MPVFASEDSSGEHITVGVPADRCPIFYQDPKNGEMIGIGVDMMRYAAETAGYDVTFKMVKEDTLKDALDNSEYDVVMPFGSAIKSTSGKATIVSDNLMLTPFILVTEGKNRLSDLNNLSIGMLRSLSGAAETVKQLYPGIQINMYETMDESVNALRSGRVEALLHNSFVWSYVLQKPSYSDLTVMPSTMFTMDFMAGTIDTPEGRELIERLNRGIASLTDTRRQAIILDYTSRHLYKYDFWDYLNQYWQVLLLIIVFLILVAVFAVRKIHSIRKEQEKSITQLIDIDTLTGALTMEGFRKRAAMLIREHPEIPYIIAYSNIKNFKYVNDSLGRSKGDELLKFWVSKTNDTLSEKEAIGRIGADHFVVLRRLAGEEMIHADDRNVIDTIRTYFTDRGTENRLQVCGGVYVLTPEDYRVIDIDHMLDLARVAERRVRENRKDGFEIYNQDQWEKGKHTVDIISYLQTAIKTGEIQVWYQPKVNYDTGSIIGAEALCRWNHTKLGWISPGEFIPTLEEAGLIHELDYFVWDRVCQDIKKWDAQGIHHNVSVNLSRYDIRNDADISGHFTELTKTYGISPGQLSIEITETVFAENPALLLVTTDKLRQAGFKVEMDDFGSGYSSLNMLKEVPVDRIKLDLHFLTKSGNMEKCQIIINYMIQMINSLGMEIIAEGVETLEQARFLQSYGCSEMQGYYFYKPMPVREFEALSDKIEKA